MIHTAIIDGVRWVCEMKCGTCWKEEYEIRIYNPDKSIWIAHVDHKHNVPVYENSMNAYIEKLIRSRV